MGDKKVVSGAELRFFVPADERPPHFPNFLNDDGHPDQQFVPSSPLPSVSTCNPPANEVALSRFVAQRSGRIPSLKYVLDTGSVTGETGEFGIYDSTCTNLLGTTGLVDLDLDGTAEAKTIAFAAATVPAVVAGTVYYVAHKNPWGDAQFGGVQSVTNIFSEFYGSTPPDIILAKRAGLTGLLTASLGSIVGTSSGIATILNYE